MNNVRRKFLIKMNKVCVNLNQALMNSGKESVLDVNLPKWF